MEGTGKMGRDMGKDSPLPQCMTCVDAHGRGVSIVNTGILGLDSFCSHTSPSSPSLRDNQAPLFLIATNDRSYRTPPNLL